MPDRTDWLLIANRRHLERVLRVYVEHYDRLRPHRGLELRPPAPLDTPAPTGTTMGVRRRDVLGGSSTSRGARLTARSEGGTASNVLHVGMIATSGEIEIAR